ncbi:MAG: Wzz/FepE/Etk N-terminal domain-containing protein [Candidatus Brocadiales bacterium]
MEEKNLDIHRLSLIFLRRKWFFIIPVAVFTVLGALIAFGLPKVYESRCVLLVEQSKVMEGVFEEEDRLSGARSLVKTVREMMLGWVPVTSMLKETGFISEEEREQSSSEVEELYDDVIDRVEFDTKSNNLIEVSFQDKQPLMAYRVMDSLLSNFMERFLGRVRSQVDSTLTFIQRDLKRLKEKLDASEEELREFEEQHFSELPGGLNNLEKLHNLKGALEQVNMEITIQKDKLALIDESLDKEGVTVLGEVIKIPNPKVAEIHRRIDELESSLASMHARYYDTHPAIVLAKKEIASLSEKLEEEEDKVVGAEKTVNNPIRQQMLANKYEEMMKLRALELRKSETETSIAELEESVKAIPSVKKELTNLRRNYDVLQGLYNNRLAQQSKEELRREMAMYVTASPFTIIEPPRIPNEPVKSTRIKVLLISIFLGLAIGTGLIFVTERLDQRFKGVDDAKEFLQVPLMGVVPTIRSAEDLFKERRKKRITIIAIGAATGAVAVLIVAMVLIAPGIVEESLDTIQRIVG